MKDIKNVIEKQLNSSDIVIYIKGTPEKPLCGFSARVIFILNELNLKYSYIDIIEHNNIRNYLPKYSDWPTFPQIYYKKILIGGCDIIIELYNNNTLKKILTN